MANTYIAKTTTRTALPRSQRRRQGSILQAESASAQMPESDKWWTGETDQETEATEVATANPIRIVKRLRITDESGTTFATIALDANGNFYFDRAIVSASDIVAYGVQASEVKTVEALIRAILAEQDGGQSGGTIDSIAVSGTGNVVSGATLSADGKTITLNKGITALTQHQNITGKADKATTLAGYGITDAYTKTQTGTQITNAINALTKSSVGLGNVDNTADANKNVNSAKILSNDLDNIRQVVIGKRTDFYADTTYYLKLADWSFSGYGSNGSSITLDITFGSYTGVKQRAFYSVKLRGGVVCYQTGGSPIIGDPTSEIYLAYTTTGTSEIPTDTQGTLYLVLNTTSGRYWDIAVSMYGTTSVVPQTRASWTSTAPTLALTALAAPTKNNIVVGNIDANTVTATEFSGPLTGNASSATKLATKRKLWGNDFDGTSAIDGDMSFGKSTAHVYIKKKASITQSNTTEVKDVEFIRLPYDNQTNNYLIISRYGPEYGIHSILAGRRVYLYSGNSWGKYVVVLDESGNFGIGTTSPSSKLHVKGECRLEHTDYGGVIVKRLAANAGAVIKYMNSNQEVKQWAAGMMNNDKFGWCWYDSSASDVLKMSLDSSGNLSTAGNISSDGTLAGVGTCTLTRASAADTYFIANRTDKTRKIAFGIGTGGTNAGIWDYQLAAWAFKTYNGTVGLNGDKLTVDSSGNAVATGDVTAYSDARLKTDVNDLDFRGSLQPKTYIKDGKKCIGFIAQEVREKYPELVHGNEAEEYLSLNYGAITAVLAAENKQLRNKVSELESRMVKMEMLMNKMMEGK